MRPETFPSNLCLLFLFFFWFSQDFCYFWSKTKKTSRKKPKKKKTKKPKKTKKTRLYEARHFPQIFVVFVFFVFSFFLFFLVFSRFFWFWPKVAKILRRPNTTKIRTPYEARHFPQIFGLSGVWKGSRNKRIESIQRSFRKPLKIPNFCSQLPLLLPWKHMKHMVRIEHSEKTNMM